MRLETGVVQCTDDWPGIFIRGDNAFAYALAVRQALTLVPEDKWLIRNQLSGLMNLLASCDTRTETGRSPQMISYENRSPDLFSASQSENGTEGS